jgi:hypothetical protein
VQPLSLFALGALLVAVNLLYVPAANWRGVLSGEPNQVLYAAGFDAFASDWQQYDGRESAQVRDSAMHIEIQTANTIYSAAAPVFEDFDLRTTAQAIDGDLNNAFGVLFRLQEESSGCDMPLKIMCDLSEIDLIGVPLRLLFRPSGSDVTGYYMFLISSDGYYSLWQGGDGLSQKISAWIASDAINQGLDAENTIRVIGRDDRFQFFINGQQVDLCIPDDPTAESTYYLGDCLEGSMQQTFVDDTYSSGKIGVVVDTVQTGVPDIHVVFDDIIVTSPSDELQRGDQL